MVCIGADSDAGWSLLDGFGVWKLYRFGSKRRQREAKPQKNPRQCENAGQASVPVQDE